MNLFNLFARLFLDTKDFDENLDKSQKKASSFSSKAGTVFKAGARAVTAFATTVAAASTAIAALGTKMINFAGDIDDNAQRIGMSTDDYQLWAFAIEKAGGDAQTLAKAVQNISVFTEKLAEGNSDALLTLQKLGIEYDDFMKADNAGKLKMIVESLQGMENQYWKKHYSFWNEPFWLLYRQSLFRQTQSALPGNCHRRHIRYYHSGSYSRLLFPNQWVFVHR